MKSGNDSGEKANLPGVSVPEAFAPLPWGPARDFPVKEGHNTCGMYVRAWPVFFPVPSASGGRKRRKGVVPWDLLVLFQLPGTGLRSQSQCNELSIPMRKREGVAWGLHITHKPTPAWGWWAWDTEGSGAVSRQRSPCGELVRAQALLGSQVM